MEEEAGRTIGEAKSGKTDLRQRRPSRAAQKTTTQEGGPPSSMILISILTSIPILIFFILTMLSSLFTGDSSKQSIKMNYDIPLRPYTELRHTPKHQVKYYVNPNDIQSFSKAKLKHLDETAESNFLHFLDNQCERENFTQRRVRQDAMGWFYEDVEKMTVANKYPKPNCERLISMGYRRH